jgi:O-antigen/teichoic acid export membrane protein
MVKDSVGKFITQIIVMVLVLLVGVIINRSLGTGGKGLLQAIILIPQMLWIIGSLGVDMSNIYYSGRDPQNIPKLVSNSVWLGLVLGFGCIGVVIGGYVALHSINPGIEKQLLGMPPGFFVLMLFTVPMFLVAYFLDSIVYGMDRIHARNIKDIFTNLFFLVVTVVVVANPDAPGDPFRKTLGFGLNMGIYGALITQLFMTGFMMIYSLFLISKFTKWSLFSFDLNYFKAGLKHIGFHAWGANTATFLFYKVAQLVIVYYIVNLPKVTENDLGLYTTSSNLTDKVWFIPGAIVYALLPKITQRNAEEVKTLTAKVSRHTFLITLIILGILCIFIRPLMVFLNTAEFADACYSFWALAPGVLVLAMGKVYGTHLLGTGKAYYAFWFSIITLIINTVLNILWIPVWGIVGSAVATSIAYTIQTVMLYWAFIHETRISPKELIIFNKEDWNVYSRGMHDLWGYIKHRIG